MQQLANKRILLGISGGIAAYKTAELVRAFKKAGAEVRVAMTQGAKEFITPLTLQALSGNPVHHTLLDPEAEAGMGHIELAKWADLIVIAPASANAIARLSQGMGDDLLTTLCLASDAPIALCPAMNQAMWRDGSTQANIQRLQQDKGKALHIFGPAAGEQACGDVGPGRMLEPELIAEQCAQLFELGELAGLKVTITAGPTREAIDPVRYISNHSSGKMGYALAEAARDAGAQVTLISGPVNLNAPERVKRISITSAEDMLTASLDSLAGCDIFIAAAAVADYRMASIASQKLKKTADSDEMTLTLVKNPDVIATVANAEQPQRPPLCVGFAAETQDVIGYARDKLARKNLDLIIANDVSNPEIGFNSEDNAVTAIWTDDQQSFAITSKSRLARALISLIRQRFNHVSL